MIDIVLFLLNWIAVYLQKIDEIVIQLLRGVVFMWILLRQLGIVCRLVLNRLNSNLLLIYPQTFHLKVSLIVFDVLVKLFVLLLLAELMEFGLCNRFGGPFIYFKAHLIELNLLLIFLYVFLILWSGEPQGLLSFLNGLCLS